MNFQKILKSILYDLFETHSKEMIDKITDKIEVSAKNITENNIM